MPGDESLTSRLDALRQRAWERVPDLMRDNQRWIAEIEATVARGVVSAGERAPEIALPQAGSGQVVRLSEVLARGPAVVAFYRGHW